jgi:hypothetical protein
MAASRRLLLATSAAFVVLLGMAGSAYADYTVDTTADLPDVTLDGVCADTNTDCTLRAAIQESNNSTTVDDTIDFSPGFDGAAANGTIVIGSNLPSITDQVTIDGGDCGMTADSEPCAGIEGMLSTLNGLDVPTAGAGSTIRNLAFSNLHFGITLGGGNVDVTGSWFGIDLDEATTMNGLVNGVLVNTTSGSNQIGDGTVAGRNLFAQNAQTGVLIQAGDDNEVVGNYFGTNRAGAAPMAGFVNGDAIHIFGIEGGSNPATDNVVGGPDTAGNTACDGDCNLIANFTDDGIDLSDNFPPGSGSWDPADSTIIKGNYIGLAANGTDGNSQDCCSGKAGIEFGGSPTASNTLVGGPNAADRNYIGGNPEGIQTGQVSGAGTTVQNNFFGLNPAGTAAVPNTVDNVDVSGPVQVLDNRVGHNGTGNGVEGIYAYGNGTVIRGNVLGVGVNGADLPFSSDAPAIRTQSSTVFNTIGGTGPGQGNLIANGGTLGGIYLDGANSNSVLGNFIGTDSTGTADLGNTGPGINVTGTTGSNRRTTIGGIAAGAGNLISNNGGDAIQVTSVNGVEIVGNRGAGNGDLFIELQPPSGAGNTGANQGIQPPAITSFDSATSVGGTSAPNAVIRLYAKSSDANGELGNLLASATANGAGQWTTTVVAQPEDQRLVATQAVNSADGFSFPQTSELSAIVRIDTIAPAAPSITSTDPGSPANDDRPEVKGAAEAGVTVRLYSGASCMGDVLATGTDAQFADPGLTPADPVAEDATTTFWVSATDPAGHSSCSASGFDYVEDSTAPVITIDSAPSGTTSDTTPTVEFSVDDATATTTCQVDSGPVEACTSPATFSPLGDGPHTITVFAADPAGNLATEPVSFTIATPPVTTPPVTTTPAPKKKCKKGSKLKKVKGKKKCVKKKKRK